MDNDDLAGAVAMRMRILFGWTAVCGPARVANTIRAVNRGLPDYFFQIVKFPRSAANLDLSVLGNHSYTGGIITAVFEAPQAVEDEGNDFLGADISDDSAHSFLSERSS